MIRCKDCKYWGAEESGYAHDPGYQLCTKISTGKEAATVWDREGDGELLTLDAFGCILGEAKE